MGYPEQDMGLLISDELFEEAQLDSNVEIIERVSIQSILKVFQSGIGLDISKNHTGVCLWKDGVLETLGFSVASEYDKSDYMAEAKMRLEFKNKLYEILKDYEWEVCIVEDVYGGANFDTTRKLLALNCVVDELVLENKIKIKELYRFKETEWIRDLRKIRKMGTKLNPKYECQQILEYLGFDLVLENKDKKSGYLSEIFYEDRCDATGQLLALAMHKNSEDKSENKSVLKSKDIKVHFLEDLCQIPDDCVQYCLEIPSFDKAHIEKCLIDNLSKHPENIVYAYLNTTELGAYGMKKKFNFYSSGIGVILAYTKEFANKLK